MKGSKKASKFQFLTILPAHLGVMKSFEGKVGYLENINSAVQNLSLTPVKIGV